MLLVGLGLCGAAPVSAHDFWLQPSEYWPKPHSTTPILLEVGHGPFRQRSPIRLSRITRFAAIGPDGAMIDLRGDLHLSGATEDGALRLHANGTYVLVLETDNNAQSHLPSIRFNDYLRAEGLTPALEQRARAYRTDADGSESYSRRAKSLVQVGSPGPGTPSQVTEPLGLTLEIVPEKSPYALPRPETLPVRVFYEAQPLAGALVKLTNLEHDAAPFETQLTDREGRASFIMPKDGTWLLNVIWTRPIDSGVADFETVFSSLSFGFPASRGAK